MRRLVLIAVATIFAIGAWAALVFAAAIFGWGRPTLAARGDTAAFMQAASDRIDADANGNAVLTLIEDGQVVGAHNVSRGRPVDSDTLFQVASLSKWVTAWGVMTLVDAGRIDLDAPVSRYLTRWQLPPSEFDNNGVTVRRLLSHTAGLTDGLGYAGFEPGQTIDTLEQSLTRATDASPGRDGIVRVGAEPGGEWDYSGGGYTLLQLLIEEVSGEPFNAYMRRAVLEPLGMARSTYELPQEVISSGSDNIAEIFGPDGEHAIHYNFTAKAAASLYTSAADLTRFVQAHVTGPNGEPPGRGVLRPETLIEMRRPHAFQFGAPIWGLGVILNAPNNAGDYVIGHDGGNFPAINTAVRVNPATGDGVVILETGSVSLATALAAEWVFWETGNVDFLALAAIEARNLLRTIAIGGGVIFILGLIAAWVWRPRRKAAVPS